MADKMSSELGWLRLQHSLAKVAPRQLQRTGNFSRGLRRLRTRRLK